jgi:hypothetical protein
MKHDITSFLATRSGNVYAIVPLTPQARPHRMQGPQNSISEIVEPQQDGGNSSDDGE